MNAMDVEKGSPNRSDASLENQDFYAPLFVNDSVVKVLYVVLGVTLLPVNLALLYAIVWFERFGSDLKRNLTNQLAATMLKSGMEYELLVAPLTFLRLFTGPLPKPVCFLKMVIMNSILMQVLLLHDAVVLSKFILLSVVKNPFAVNDDFWSLWVTLWVAAFSLANEFTFAFLPGRMPMEYQLCAGTNPLLVAEQKINMPLLVTYFITLVVNAVVPFKIYNAKVRDKGRNPQNTRTRYRVQSLGLYSFSTSLVIVVTMSLSMLTILIPYRINQNRAIEAEFHSTVYLLTILLPQLTVILTIVGYLTKHESLRKGLWRSTLEAWNDR